MGWESPSQKGASLYKLIARPVEKPIVAFITEMGQKG